MGSTAPSDASPRKAIATRRDRRGVGNFRDTISRMSFSSIFKKTASILLTVGKVVEPIAIAAGETALPEFKNEFVMLDDLFKATQDNIAAVEVVNASGATKQAKVAADFEAGLNEAAAVFNMTGKTITYDTVALKAGIDAQVAAYNAFATVKASIKVT